MKSGSRIRLGVLASHPVQYYAPLFRELASRVDVHVFFAHRATPQQQAAAGFGTPFEWDVDLTSGYEHTFLRNVSKRPGTGSFLGCDTPEVGARLAQGDFDGVLALGWHLKSMWQGIIAAKRLRLPVLMRGDSQLGTPRSLAKRAVKAAAYPPLLRLFDAGLYVGERNRAYYQRYRYPPERLFFSPHCVDNAWFAARATVGARRELRDRLGVRPDEPLILFAGKLMRFKRPTVVVEAVARLRRGSQPKAALVIAGSGELEAEVAARARALDVPVHSLGFQNQTAMPAVYAAAEVLVLPSSGRETWGLVCNEALACGRPIVVSDEVGCAADLAADQAAGRTFCGADPDACAASLEDLLRNPPGPSAVRAKSEAYGLEKAAEGVLSGLDALTGRGRRDSVSRRTAPERT